MIRNPILPGFNPDPSICRVGTDYYIATSTFEWYPGVQIHHSQDLVNWRLVARPLRRGKQLDMRGDPDSCGVWAPCLSHADGKFWLAYTDVKRYDGNFKDAPNYITTCATIDGDWSDPFYVNNSGFDPSLFHGADGRKYFMNMQWNYRGKGTGGNPKHASFDGILLQEWSPEKGLFGPVKNIYAGTARGLTEAPHIFRRGDYYYLTTAEGGTVYDHAVTIARSRDIWGPYEDHPNKYLICAADAPDHPIQKTGHGQYLETHDGQFYHTFLMGRPIPDLNGQGRFCPLGRETGIERLVWGEDAWPYLEAGGLLARSVLPGLADVEPDPPVASYYDFTGGQLPDDLQWLRSPEADRIFRVNNGSISLYGRESMGSWFEQSLVARRVQHFAYSAETEVDFEPTTYQQTAGLTLYYNRFKFHKLLVTYEPGQGRSLTLVSCLGDYPDGNMSFALNRPLPCPDRPIGMRAVVDHAALQFFWRTEDADWRPIGPVMDASLVSDEGGRGGHGSFTGAFIGLFAMDMTGQGKEARFSFLSYRPEGT